MKQKVPRGTRATLTCHARLVKRLSKMSNPTRTGTALVCFMFHAAELVEDRQRPSRSAFIVWFWTGHVVRRSSLPPLVCNILDRCQTLRDSDRCARRLVVNTVTPPRGAQEPREGSPQARSHGSGSCSYLPYPISYIVFALFPRRK
jgi:hypothetical protein